MSWEEERRKLIKEGLQLYDKYHQEYVNISPENYSRRLEKKRQLGISPLYKLKRIDIEDFIQIPFLEAEKREEAEAILEEMENNEISYVIISVKRLVGGPAWTALRNWACDYKAQMKLFKEGKKTYAINAESRQSRARSRGGRQNRIVPAKHSIL